MSKFMVVCICLVAFTQLGWSQAGNASFVHGKQAHGIPGYLDPSTHTFTTKAESAAVQDPDALPPTVTEFAGTWTFKITITISSAMPAGAQIFCSASIDEFDDPTNSYSETAAVPAIVSKGSGTCSVAIPYAWFLSNQGSDVVSASYDINMYQAIAIGSTTQVVPIRESHDDLGTNFPVPANGALTTTNVTARI